MNGYQKVVLTQYSGKTHEFLCPVVGNLNPRGFKSIELREFTEKPAAGEFTNPALTQEIVNNLALLTVFLGIQLQNPDTTVDNT